VVAEINRLIGIVRDLNVRRRENFRNAQDAGLDAQLHQALEELSELADFNVLFQPDGSVSLFLNGQEAMLVGDRQYLLQTAVLDGKLQILDFEGNDLAGQTKSGRLGALLELRNSSIPSYEADLNNLAQALADRVNGLLAGGVDLNGQPPAKNLFTYDATVGAAISLRVTDITGAELAMALPSAPGGNGNALLLAELSNSIEIDGYTFTEYYGNIAARVGRQLDTARSELDSQESLLTQARSLREEVSGVSLDAEAAKLVQFQRNYEAVGRLLTVLDELTETIIGLVR
jgi:flagellar hook-associated protein 1 FlgK